MNRVVRRKQLLELMRVSSTTQWRMELAGEYPAGVKRGKGFVGSPENGERVLGRLQEKKGSVADQVIGTRLGVDSKLPLRLGADQAKNKDRC